MPFLKLNILKEVTLSTQRVKSRNLKKTFIFIYVYVCAFHIFAGGQGDQKKALGPLQIELQAALGSSGARGSWELPDLGVITELDSSGRAATAYNY